MIANVIILITHRLYMKHFCDKVVTVAHAIKHKLSLETQRKKHMLYARSLHVLSWFK
jgi:hypothetical protein